MRVALLTSSRAWRGSSASFAKIASGMTARGHASLVFTAAPQLTARMREEGVAVHELTVQRTGLPEVVALHRGLRAFRADLVVVDTPRDQRLAVLAGLPARTAVVYRYNLTSRSPRDHLADRLFLGRTAALAFQSAWIREDTYGRVPWLRRLPAYQIPNGYDTARFAPDRAAGEAFRAARGIAPDAAVVATGSALQPKKGHEVSFRAVAQLAAAGRPVTYVVCGDGCLRGELEALAQRLGVTAIFTGFLAPAEMVAAYNGADVVVHPSASEIFPNVVGEAMACARPVVGADAGGLPELLGRSGETGILARPNDPDGMAAGIVTLLQAPERAAAMGRAARERIRAEFSMERMISGYEAMFREVLHRAGRASRDRLAGGRCA